MTVSTGAETGATIEPLTVSIQETCRLLGSSRSEVYRLLARGNLRAVKAGVRTQVLMASIKAHVASLPPATFRAPKGAA